MEEIKKRFDEYFKGNIDENSYIHINTVYVRNFIQSEIDLAVSKERERVASKIDEVWDLLCQMDTNIKSEKEYAKDIINLINNK